MTPASRPLVPGFLPRPHKSMESLAQGIQKELLHAMRGLNSGDFQTMQISLEVALSLVASHVAGGEVEVYYQQPADVVAGDANLTPPSGTQVLPMLDIEGAFRDL